MATSISNGVKWHFGQSGSFVMENPKTINRYHQLRAQHPNTDDYGMFFAFGDKQFEEGRKMLIEKGYMKEGDKVVYASGGLYGTKSEVKRYLDFYEERSKRIKAECNPQEVYFYECNNHEVMLTHDDDEAMKVVISYFGNETAHKVERIYEATRTSILAPLTERDKHLAEHQHDFMMLGRLKFDCDGFFNKDDCRYHRPDCLWARCVRGQIDKMRELFFGLPDDIKDESPISRAEIEKFGKMLTEWAEEEFGKDKYNPYPRTPRADFPEELILDEHLWYTDDDGKMQEPHTIWFSCDSRRWHFDARKVHGLAYTSYLGKKGTTLAPVYHFEDFPRPSSQYRNKELCEVSCSCERLPAGQTRLYDFCYE